jgi:hypothetical protein
MRVKTSQMRGGRTSAPATPAPAAPQLLAARSPARSYQSSTQNIGNKCKGVSNLQLYLRQTVGGSSGGGSSSAAARGCIGRSKGSFENSDFALLLLKELLLLLLLLFQLIFKVFGLVNG